MDKIKRYFKGDPVIWGVLIGLMLCSIPAIYSASDTMAIVNHGGDIVSVVTRHIVILAIGFVFVFALHHIHYRYYRMFASVILIISIILLLLTFSFGATINDASRWLKIPGIGFTIQTSDIAKVGLIIFVARELSARQKYIHDLKTGFLPIFMAVMVVVAIILPSNFSTAIILAMTCMILMYVGSVRIVHLLLGGFAIIVALVLFLSVTVLMKKAGVDIPSVTGRVTTWINRVDIWNDNYDEKGDDYQREQAYIAIATGGFLGKGPGNSTQRALLPQSNNDFIFAIIIEEYGLFGALILLSLYTTLIVRTAMLVKKCSAVFPAFLAIGLALNLVIPAMLNMGIAVGLLPVTGQALTLVSWGGSSLVMSCVAMGIILSISRDVERVKPVPAEDTGSINNNNENQNG